ncbi:MAG: FIST N-terminal domain-containing protein [Comamonas sp.]
MPFFPCAHAGHPLWPHAVRQVVVQLGAQISMQNLHAPANLGLVYVSASYAEHASEIVAMLSKALPQVQHWVGCAAHSVLAGDMDYGHTGAIAVMLPYLKTQDYQVFSGIAPWHQGAFAAHSALVHGDASSPGIGQQVHALRQHMGCDALVGGVCHLSHEHTQWSWGARAAGGMPSSMGGSHGGIQMGGLSGVAFSANVDCLTVGMQGCKPVGATHTMTRVEGDTVLELDGQPALEVFFGDMNWGDVLAQQHPNIEAVWRKVQNTLLATTPSGRYVHGACLDSDARVVRVAGVNPWRQTIVLESTPVQGQVLTICQPDALAARADMRRACAELWESLTAPVAHASLDIEPAAASGRSICGAVYIRNQQRQLLPRSPRVDAELQWIRHALGPVPLLGFSSTHEIDAGEVQHLSAQLLVFTQPLQALS